MVVSYCLWGSKASLLGVKVLVDGGLAYASHGQSTTGRSAVGARASPSWVTPNHHKIQGTHARGHPAHARHYFQGLSRVAWAPWQ